MSKGTQYISEKLKGKFFSQVCEEVNENGLLKSDQDDQEDVTSQLYQPIMMVRVAENKRSSQACKWVQ